jgi:hypothetical protein
MSADKPSLDDLVAAEREVMVPSADTRARGLEGLRAALAEGRPPIVDVPPQTPASAGGGSGGLIVVGLVAVGLVGLVGLVAVGLDRESATPPVPTPVQAASAPDDESPKHQAPPATGESAPDVPSPAAADEEPPDTDDLVAPTAAESTTPDDSDSADSGRTRRRPPETPPPSSRRADNADSAFAEELRLLKKAKADDDAGRHDAALRTLDTAARRFGTGFFDEERRALRVRVLCALGRAEAGRAAANAFFRDYPASPQTERVRHACD